MPFVRIMLGPSAPQDAGAVGRAVHQALMTSLGVPEGDHFQVISRHSADEAVYDPSYLGVERTDGIVFLQITMALGRTVELKRALCRAIADQLAADCGVRPQDVFISLVETPYENWSFGNGELQFADRVPPHLAQRGAATSEPAS
jgi:hypothetical protein